MPIELATQYLGYVDEMFSTESKSSLLTNQDFNWEGASTVKVYRVGTSAMTDYGRSGPEDGNWSRFGQVQGLDATTQSMTLRKDRSFTFAIDRLDRDETKQQLEAASALARQLRQVTIPEVDTWTYGEMCKGAGHKPEALALTAANIYDAITAGNTAMDNAEVPEEGRSIIVTPDVHLLMKKCRDIVMETDIGSDLRLRGVIGNLDGANVMKIPKKRLPVGFGFMIVHPSATIAPVKLADYRVHEEPPGISGSLVEGRINYDAFVLANKAAALYYQAQK